MIGIQKGRLIALLFFVSTLLFTSCGGISPRHLRNLEGPGVEFQNKKVYEFKDAGIYFSNKFDGARLNEVSSLNDSTFVIRITPENKPINPSPWYAFQIWTTHATARPVHLVLDYGDSKHRYWPKWRASDYGKWKEVEALDLNEAQTQARFVVPVSTDRTWVSGHPLFNRDSILNWLDGLNQKPFVHLERIGKSTLGAHMLGFHTEESPSKKAIVILGGQHPPEVTGFQAQMAFVNFLLSDDPLAQSFRNEYQIVAVPWINPDGNNQGHWRHNVAGVDLNRDWANFKQKETTNARDYIQSFVEKNGVTYDFGIDFHSTWFDVLYTNKPQPEYTTHRPGLMDAWILEWNKNLGELAVREQASVPNLNLTKGWLLAQYQTEAVTYEVADTTPIHEIHHKAQEAAKALIRVLLEN
ncbi:MAG TPA: M14 family metallopeptidase [Sphingobacteriaceae bacterium]|nr:M14 family metallopeptidase [Sphingobacteriaceae bacterium]